MDEEELVRENESLMQELSVLGRDPAVFAGLLPDELNLRLKKAVAYAEEAREAELLGREPPPTYLDPASPDWMPDGDDMVHCTASQLLGDDFILLGDDALSDAEVEQQLHSVIERLAEQGISLGINETVPERLAYRYLLEELRQGMDVMPGWVLDGCDGCCEECFQLPYCKTGKELAEEYRFAVPAPPVPPREVDSETATARPRSYWRWPTINMGQRGDIPAEGSDFFGDVPF